MNDTTKPARVLVTGSRDWPDEITVSAALAHICGALWPAGTPVVFVHGGARGVDQMVEDIIGELSKEIPPSSFHLSTEAHPADWDAHGKRAGFVRNQEMVDLGADLCVAFIRNNSRGAEMCLDLARNAGIPCTVIRWDDDDRA